MSKFPELTPHLVRDALVAFTGRGLPSTAKVDDISVPWNKHSRLAALLLSSAAFPADCDAAVKEREVVEALIVAHHELICLCISFSNLRSCLTHPVQVLQLVKHGLIFVKKLEQIPTILLAVILIASWTRSPLTLSAKQLVQSMRIIARVDVLA